jgi:hypothetical protein
VFSLLNGAALWVRIRAENAALAWAISGAGVAPTDTPQADPALANRGRNL